MRRLSHDGENEAGGGRGQVRAGEGEGVVHPGTDAGVVGVTLASAARPGITHRPVTGVSPSRVAVAWSSTHDHDPVVRDFVHCRPDGPWTGDGTG